MTSRPMLWALFWVNLLGTIYGYEWYWGQMVETARHMDAWLLIYVPDSPTASLFFTAAIAYMLFAPERPSFIRGLIEAVAVISSFKYGIWAVSMIFAGASQGDPLMWEHWMLVVSHLGMAVEAVLFVRFFRFRLPQLLIAAVWTISNEYVDYTYGVYPSLPDVLTDDLTWIRNYTFALSICGIAIATFGLKKKTKTV